MFPAKKVHTIGRREAATSKMINPMNCQKSVRSSQNMMSKKLELSNGMRYNSLIFSKVDDVYRDMGIKITQEIRQLIKSELTKS